MNLKPLLSALSLVLIALGATALPTTPLPADLQLVPSAALPGRGTTWWSVQRWNKFPPSPVNWCAGRTNVLYYYSPSFGTNKIIIDDTLIDYTQTQATTALATSTESSGTLQPLGPPFGPNDIWLDIKFHGNTSNNLVDVILHGATNGVWQLLTKTNLDDTNAWTALEIKEQKGTSNYLTFGPYPDKSSPATFFRGELLTNLFIVVATNLHYPSVIDYHPTNRSLIISYNPAYDATNAFGIIDENAFLTNWSDLGWIPSGFGGYTLRFATAKTTANGFTNGDLFFGSSLPGVAAEVGWLSADAMRSKTNWVILDNDYNQVTDLYIDQTGKWSNDLVAVTSRDGFWQQQSLNVWRIHSPTDVQQITSIAATHLEGLLTLPDDESRYGPWAGKLLTADRNYGQIFAVNTNGTYTTTNIYLTNSLGIAVPVAADGIRLIETNQPLYCLGYKDDTSLLLKIPAAVFNQSQGDILMLQSGITGLDPALFIARWSSTNATFEVSTIRVWDYLPDAYVDHLGGCVFAPIQLRPIP